MDKYRHNMFVRLGELGRTRLAVMLALGVGAAIAAAVLVPGLFGGGGPGSEKPALAVIQPIGCATGFAGGSGVIQLDPMPITPVTDGNTLNYAVGAFNPSPVTGFACDAFNVHVAIKVPGATAWVEICTIDGVDPDINSGETRYCPGTTPYIVDGADASGGVLTAFAKARGSRHNGASDCVDPNPSDFDGTSPCFGGEASVPIDYVPFTPTPTPTDTPTSTPTDTPTSTATATDTPTNTPTPTATDTPTSTATATDTPTSTATATDTPTNTPTPTATDTPTSTATATDTPTSTATATDTPTSTPTPPTGQGCTPGFWKTHTDATVYPNAWPPTGISPNDKVKDLFTRAGSAPYASLGNRTLAVGLAFQGGSTIQGAAEILLRAAIAAVLNASHPDISYPYPGGVAGIEAAVNAALNSQDRGTILTLAAILDFDNNSGCPISGK